mgnify:CR=1 FL=1
MKTIQSAFKSFCIEKFGTEQGLKVYKFYTKLFFPSGKDFFANKKTVTLTEKRIKNITYLLDKYGVDAFLEGIERHNIANVSGVLPTLSVAYFMKIVENVAKEKTIPEATKKKVVSQNSLDTIQIDVCIPVVYKRVRNDYQDDFYNYSYLCNCKQELSPWDTECPKCKLKLDWSKVILWF